MWELVEAAEASVAHRDAYRSDVRRLSAARTDQLDRSIPHGMTLSGTSRQSSD
jgi:hypothetical protein